jgi:hypothetical protein
MTDEEEPMAMTEAVSNRSPPPGWGDDELTAFFDMAHHNRFATFFQRKEAFARLVRIDRCFLTIAKDWLNPQSVVGALLFLRTHAYFRAACEHATAAQLAESFVIGRAALEAAAYGLHISRNPTLAEVWLRRHDDLDHEKAAKAEFVVHKVQESIRKVDRDAAAVFSKLYQLSIDHGAHPNERSVTVSTARDSVPSGTAYSLFSMHDDPMRIDFVLRSMAQIGVCTLVIWERAFPARFELLGVKHEILELRKGL